MNLYRQSIILFGVIIPMLVAAAIVGGGYVMKSKMQASYETKKTNYTAYEQDRKKSNKIEGQVIKQRDDLKRWEDILSQQTASATQATLREIYEKLPSKEIQQTAFDPQNQSTGLGSASAQKSSQVRIAFRGTYRTMQKAFLELETKMPQLQLQEFKMEPISSSAALMNFQVTYSAWEK